MISLEKLKILTPLKKLPKNVGDLGKLIVTKALKCCPKSNKSPNLVTLITPVIECLWNTCIDFPVESPPTTRLHLLQSSQSFRTTMLNLSDFQHEKDKLESSCHPFSFFTWFNVNTNCYWKSRTNCSLLASLSLKLTNWLEQ